jgi:hypothetical protein
MGVARLGACLSLKGKVVLLIKARSVDLVYQRHVSPMTQFETTNSPSTAISTAAMYATEMLSSIILSTLSLYLATVFATPNNVQQQSLSTNALRVPVTLGVMSRCPDALLCETLFDKVIPRVAEKIDISFAYIATYA